MITENFLRFKEFCLVVNIGMQEPSTNAALSEAKKTKLDSLRLKDLKAKKYIFMAIDHPILKTILCKDTTKKNGIL